ncbi:MAG TPA: plastocyanin/azurin family copper-binding protein [Gaiellaceae bacterium]|nr:plastocyanin/azurin family copper-binding protein [Gaiellaceae bacterium]
MTKHAPLLALAIASAVLVAVPAVEARPARAAATVAATAGKPSEFKFALSAKSVKHGAVTFTVTNQGSMPHDFRVCSKATKTAADTCAGKTTALISPGAKATLKMTFKAAGTYEYLCTVPGHAAVGMKGLLKVT